MKIELSVIRIILSNEFPWPHKYHDLFITLFILFLDFPVFQLFFLIPFLLPFVVMVMNSMACLQMWNPNGITKRIEKKLQKLNKTSTKTF